MSEETQGIGKLALALSKAQGAIKNAAKDAQNPAFKRGEKISTYADLASVWDACRAALTQNEIAVIQQVSGGPDTVTVTTVLAHSSGESISCSVTGKPTKMDVQGMGSTVTYLRRYSLASMVGVAPEDDDGNAASEGSHKATPKAESAAVKAAAEQKPGIFLDTGNGAGSTHATAGAFLDALETAMKYADDPMMIFDLNSKTLEAIQSKAIKAKNESMAGRVKAIYDSLHTDPVPDLV